MELFGTIFRHYDFLSIYISSSLFHFYADVIELPSDKCCTTLDEVGRKEWSNRWSIAKCGKAATAIVVATACWLLLQLLQCSWKFPSSSLMICFGRNFREMILFCSKSCWGWCSTLHYWKQWPLFTIIAVLHLKLLSFWVFSINTCNGTTTRAFAKKSLFDYFFFLLSFGSTSSSSHTQSMYKQCASVHKNTSMFFKLSSKRGFCLIQPLQIEIIMKYGKIISSSVWKEKRLLKLNDTLHSM